jgi:hypothetical protein
MKKRFSHSFEVEWKFHNNTFKNGSVNYSNFPLIEQPITEMRDLQLAWFSWHKWIMFYLQAIPIALNTANCFEYNEASCLQSCRIISKRSTLGVKEFYLVISQLTSDTMDSLSSESALMSRCGITGRRFASLRRNLSWTFIHSFTHSFN